MTKIRTTITIDPKLLELTQHHRIRISTFLDNNLRNYLSQINGSNNLRKVEAAGSNPAQSIVISLRDFVRLMLFCQTIYFPLYSFSLNSNKT